MTIIEEHKARRAVRAAPDAGMEQFYGKTHVAVIFSDLCREMGPQQERLLLHDADRLKAAGIAIIRVYDGKVTPLLAAEGGLRSKTVRAQLNANSVIRFSVVLVDKKGEVRFRAMEPTGSDVLLSAL